MFSEVCSPTHGTQGVVKSLEDHELDHGQVSGGLSYQQPVFNSCVPAVLLVKRNIVPVAYESRVAEKAATRTQEHLVQLLAGACPGSLDGVGAADSVDAMISARWKPPGVGGPCLDAGGNL